MDNENINSTNNLNILATQVLENYSVKPVSISVIQSGTIKTVWKVKTKDDMLCLKRLKQSYDKALFSANAQHYIYKRGGNVPAIVKDKNGQLIVNYNEQLFVLYKWIHGKDLNFNNTSDLSSALQGLAKFHLSSKGYTSPENARVSSKLGKWPEQYKSMRDRLAKWKEISKNIALPYHSAYLKYVDPMIKMADTVLSDISASDYKKLTSPQSDVAVLCHQDFGRGNAILTENGVYVIDLDGVTFDLPARDLRKIIGKKAENKNNWNIEDIRNIIGWYTKINQLSTGEKDVLYLDLLFPHWFFGLVKNLFQNNKPLKPSEIERIATLEQSKTALLKPLVKKNV